MREEVRPAAWFEHVNRLALVGRVLAGTMHDVSNALQIIGGSAELLQLQASRAEMVERRVAAIGSQTKRANALLSRLTAFYRDTATDTTTVDLRNEAEVALALRDHTLNRLRVTASIDGEAQTVVANAREVLQVMLNLLVNAEDALTRVEDRSIRLSVERSGDRAQVVVADSGPGVPPAAAAHLYDPWPNPTPPSLGIGLHVSRALAARHRGTLVYEPNQPNGARFILSFPAASGC